MNISDKGKPVKRQRRKAKGSKVLLLQYYDSLVTERIAYTL